MNVRTWVGGDEFICEWVSHKMREVTSVKEAGLTVYCRTHRVTSDAYIPLTPKLNDRGKHRQHAGVFSCWFQNWFSSYISYGTWFCCFRIYTKYVMANLIYSFHGKCLCIRMIQLPIVSKYLRNGLLCSGYSAQNWCELYPNKWVIEW